MSFRMMGKFCAAVLVLSTIVVPPVLSLPTENQLDNGTAVTTSKLYANMTWEEPKRVHKGNKTSKINYCLTSPNVSDFMKKLMENSKYNVHLVPGFEKGKPLNISLALTVLVFRDIKEVDMTYTVDFFLRTRWVDQRLKNSLGCTFTMTMGKKHPAEIIWVPDTMIENSVTSSLHDVVTNNHKIDISPEGEVFWSTRVTAKVMCQMDLVKYPRDTQTCSIVFLSYSYPTVFAYYVWNDNNPVSVMDTSLSQFDVTSFGKKSYVLTYVAGEYSILEATFVFERRLGFYLIQVYIPCIFLVVLAGLSFWVDAKATPARVALSLTTLLTIATIWSSTNSNMPPVSYIKAVDIYFLTSFGFVLTTLLEYIVVLNYYILKDAIKEKLSCENTQDEKKKGSFCTKHGSLLKKRNITSSKNSEDNHELQDHYSNGALENSYSNNVENTSQNKKSDQKIVTSIDKITRFVYPTAYTIFNIVYWYRLRKE